MTLTGTTPRLLLVGMLVCAAAAVPAVDAPAAAGPGSRITVQDLGTLGGPTSSAWDVNERGQVVGIADTASGVGHAFLWERGVMHDLGTLGGDGSGAVAINARGQVVGTSDTATGETHAFLWERGVMHDLGGPAGGSSSARLVNSRGQVVVEHVVVDGFDLEVRPYLWDDGTLTPLGMMNEAFPEMYATDISDRGWVTGYGWSATGAQDGFLWRDGTLIDLGPSQAWSLNEAGQVSGSLYDPDGTVNAIWQDGSWTPLDQPGSDGLMNRINERGTVVGWNRYDGLETRPVLYRDGEVVDLDISPGAGAATAVNDRDQAIGYDGPDALLWDADRAVVLPPLDATGSAVAHEINARGVVVGWSSTADGATRAVLWTTSRGS